MKLPVIHKKITIYEYEQLFKKYYKELCVYANTIIKSESVAEEIVQDLFVKIWNKRASIFFQKNPKNYLVRAVKNNCMLWIRNNIKLVDLELNEIDQVYASASTAEEQLSADEISKIYESTLESLPPRWREIFHLIRHDGLKYRETAAKLNISIKTVEKAMGKTLKVFRQNLTEYVS